MKNILIALLFFYSLSSFGTQDKDTNINAGFGVFGSRGIFGISVDKFYTRNHAISVAFGADFVGATTTVGYKYFGEKINNSNTVWDKCFFLFECDSRFYIGPSLQYANGSALKIREGSSEREYKLDPKWLGLISVGSRDVLKNNMTFDFEISYRSIITGGKASQTAGLGADDTKAIEMGYRAIGINVGVGYLF